MTYVINSRFYSIRSTLSRMCRQFHRINSY